MSATIYFESYRWTGYTCTTRPLFNECGISVFFFARQHRPGLHVGRLILSDRAAKQNCEAHAARSAQTACHVRAGFHSALPSGKKIKNIIHHRPAHEQIGSRALSATRPDPRGVTAPDSRRRVSPATNKLAPPFPTRSPLSHSLRQKP